MFFEFPKSHYFLKDYRDFLIKSLSYIFSRSNLLCKFRSIQFYTLELRSQTASIYDNSLVYFQFPLRGSNPNHSMNTKLIILIYLTFQSKHYENLIKIEEILLLLIFKRKIYFHQP